MEDSAAPGTVRSWLEYGLTLSASGGFGGLPRIFDSSIYRDAESNGGDTDLCAPNESCKPPGPGRGAGGAPGMEGENCDPLGNVLIIQEEGVDVPDDSGTGGELIFDFMTPAKLVNSMDFLDIHSATMVWVTHITQFGEFQTLLELPLLGHNSWQMLEINIENVKQIKVDMSGSGAVASLSFCFPESTPEPVLQPTPSPSPVTQKPTNFPTVQPTSPPMASSIGTPTEVSTANTTESPTTSPALSSMAAPPATPTDSPTSPPLESPTLSPTAAPIASSTASPTLPPTESLTLSPTAAPSASPTISLTSLPTESPTSTPAAAPTARPTTSPAPLPTISPTETPTTQPTSTTFSSLTAEPISSPTIPPTPRICTGEVMIDFEIAANGTQLAPGLYVENEWAEYGLTLSVSGGQGDLPRLFDTGNPLVQDTGGDFDLGAPNWRCSPPGPGRGEGGEPDMPGENCDPLGNVLIIQEEDVDIPDDNFQGGMIVFDFADPVEFVYGIGFLDVDEEDATVTVTHVTDEGLTMTVFEVPLLGDNSKQTLDIRIENVTQIKLSLDPSGAVTFLSFCPAATPPYVVDFETAADGSSIPAVAYLETEWTELGLTLSASGGFGTLPRVINSSNPGNEIVGGLSLGSPNKLCSPTGPGIGEGGEPDTEGENCIPLGNVLNVEGAGNPLFPVGSVDGGLIIFEFEPVALHVYKVGLLDRDVGATFTIVHETDEGLVVQKGVNSYQTVRVATNNMKLLVVSIERSGAITFISFDPLIVPSLPMPAPSTVSPLTSFPPTKMSMVMSMSMSMVIEIPTPKPPMLFNPTVSPSSPTHIPTTAEPSKSSTFTPVMATPEPQGSISPSPYRNVTVTFDMTADDESVPDGSYIKFEWAKYGMTLSAMGGFGTLPCIVDTTNPNDEAVDLGSPNEQCNFMGPGIGEGGEPETKGKNCQSLGNVIVAQDNVGDTSVPNDNADASMIILGVIGSTGGGSASAAEMPCKEGLAADDAGEAGKGEPGLMVVLFESEPSKK